jgi:ABC-type dipeptide/oligopeptide/nickel transport system permease component
VIRFVVKRLALAVLVLFVSSLASFWFFATNTDPLQGHPVLPEYWAWLKGIWTGRSTHSLLSNFPLWPMMLHALVHTCVLLVAALALVVVGSVALAVVAARRPGSAVDLLLRAASYLAWGIPAFLLALVVQLLAGDFGSAHGVGPFPIAGWPGSCPPGIGINAGTISCPPGGGGAHYVLNVLRYITLPAFTLALGFIGLHGRYLRSSLLDTLGAPYIVTARAKGLPERRVVFRHALRTSLVAFASALLADFGAIFGSALAVDWIFQLQGLGTVFIHEFPVTSYAPIDTYSVQLVLLLTASLVMISSFLGELLVLGLDPRLRAE